MVFFCSILFSQYHSYNDLTGHLQKLSKQYSIVKVQSIAKTAKGKDVWVAAVGKDETNKAILVVGGIDATQLVGSEHALRYIEMLAQTYGTVDSITALLNTTTIYVIPRVNPDASESFFEKPLNEKETNGNPYDDDRDGLTDEDDVDDVNKDGFITMMRVRDPQGEWIENPDDKRLMKKADAAIAEKGMYKLYSEGIDNDKDEEWNEDAVGGTNLNRNFAYGYEYFSKNSGQHQISEVESRALADFLFDHQNIAAVFTFSSVDNLTTPWKNEPAHGESRFITSVTKEDEPYYSYLSKKFTERSRLADAPKPEKGEGAFSEMAYYHAGRWSFSVRPWWAGQISQSKDTSDVKDSTKNSKSKKGKEKSDDLVMKTLHWYDAVGKKDVFVEWKNFHHPDFPGKEVQIGGVKPFVISNPPAESLNAFAKPYEDFITYISLQLPSITISNQKIEKIGDNVYRVSVDIINNGYLPTMNSLGVKTRWVRKVRVVLDAGKNVISTGRAKQLLDPIPGNGGFKTLSWIIVGKGEIKISAKSPTCGSAELEITLN